jgi:hypothetical protein
MVSNHPGILLADETSGTFKGINEPGVTGRTIFSFFGNNTSYFNP